MSNPLEIINQAENMLYAVVMTMSPLQSSRVRATMGAQAHAAFLATVREADYTLARTLHWPEIPQRPFTVSRLEGTEPARNGWLYLDPQTLYWWRFTGLYPPIFRNFIEHFLKGNRPPVVRLGEAYFSIHEILVTSHGHSWAGYTTWADLASNSYPTEAIRLEFHTATAFGLGQQSWGKRIGVLPDPRLVFDSLARSWNPYAPAPLHIDRKALRDYIDRAVIIKRIEGLRTRMLHFKRVYQIGFTGQVTYGLMEENIQLQTQMDTLANFAFYAGVGMKRSMGMGQVRRLEV